MPSDPFTEYGVWTSFGVGMIHGIGAETPTQVLLFATAAGVAGGVAGVILLTVFVVGLLMANTAVAIAASRGFSAGQRLPVVFVALAGLTAVASLTLGTLYVLGRGDLIPALFGG
jgi:high-affinity nickel-transport protein